MRKIFPFLLLVVGWAGGCRTPEPAMDAQAERLRREVRHGEAFAAYAPWVDGDSVVVARRTTTTEICIGMAWRASRTIVTPIEAVRDLQRLRRQRTVRAADGASGRRLPCRWSELRCRRLRVLSRWRGGHGGALRRPDRQRL